ncbi:MAG TPA: hypothetical protein VL860_07170 [Planctomycetota bacterium]|nr:hypothetical protein [Planctomycetota bacterium]
MGQHITEKTPMFYGDVDSSTALEKGDLVFLDTDDIKPAAVFTWTTDEATTRVNYVAKHIGVSGTRHAANAGATNNHLVHADGLFFFDAEAATYEVGDRVGPAKDTGNALLTTKLKKVTADNQAVGYVIEKSGANATTIKVRIKQRLVVL